MILSIIIPVYNVEKYIDKCLYSIFSQQVESSLYEVVIVNDGTLDNSMSIITPYVNKYSNIKVLNQSNQGLSSARNNGLKIANGDYIWWVDSDDCITDNSIYNVINTIKGHHPDMIRIRMRRICEEDNSFVDDMYDRNLHKIMKGKDYLFDNALFAPVQSFLFNRNFLNRNNLRFFPGIYHEDGEFVPRALYLAKEIVLVDSVCYSYLLRDTGSIMSSFRLKNFEDLITVFKNLLEFGHENVATTDTKYWMNHCCMRLIIIFIWAKEKKFYVNNKDAFWKLYNENKYLYVRYSHYILLGKYFYKRDIKNYLGVRFFPKTYIQHL